MPPREDGDQSLREKVAEAMRKAVRDAPPGYPDPNADWVVLADAAIAAYREHEQGEGEALAEAALKVLDSMSILLESVTASRGPETHPWDDPVEFSRAAIKAIEGWADRLDYAALVAVESGPPRAVSTEHSGRAALPEEDKG